MALVSMTENLFLLVDEAAALGPEDLVDDVPVVEKSIDEAALVVQGTEVYFTTHSVSNV
jgi:hypothetical protein